MLLSALVSSVSAGPSVGCQGSINGVFLLFSPGKARQGGLEVASCSAVQSRLGLVEAYPGEEEAARVGSGLQAATSLFFPTLGLHSQVSQ